MTFTIGFIIVQREICCCPELSNFAQFKNDKLTVACTHSFARVQVSWLHNGSPVKKSKDIDIFYDNGRCSLVIYEVYLEDAGEYICVGKNENGSTQTSCRLIVERTFVFVHINAIS